MVYTGKKQLTALGLAILLGFSLMTSGCATKSTAQSDEALSRAEAAASRAEAAANRAEAAAEKAERIFEKKMKK
ncbi:alanine-zipper protein [Desulfopila aestuarii]|uniref:Lipoprotein n=1 Tax=Desulfopila aestuarii DSM 18488 TaxID=1121416 RepID=A0A1M7YAJ5_9BACT|nr:alanine-zipper protein [Desulfopila aestuarii]SHO49619.1 hypothetical protein SAMN02745220_02942 [Desulfopila aestuarii DSM 18488]